MRNSEQMPPTLSLDCHNQLWMVPYARNPYFIGREAELQEIATMLSAGQNGTSGLAISGSGGIGKTQLALEYAYRRREEYRYVFWVLAETRNTLNAAYSDIAELLDLPEKGQQEQFLVVRAIENWLAKNNGWLLILDNVRDLTLLKDFLPTAFSGHLLLTTRASTTGKLAKRIKLKKLDAEDGSRLLLHRAGILPGPTGLAETAPKDYEAARVIVAELDGLPLALDLAGAYIAETSCSLPGYLELLRREHAGPSRERGELVEDQSGPVEKTVRLTCAKVAKANPAATDLLRLCAFLAPDEILETLIVAGAPALTKPLQKLASNPARLNATLAMLQKYALVAHDPEIQALALQREVQAALRAMMPEEVERAWAERAVRVVGSIFPTLKVDDWEACQRLLPHAQECAAWIERWQIELVEGAWLLHHAGWYLHNRAEYAAAQAYEEKALAIYRSLFGDEHPATAMILNNLAVTYEDRGKLKDAALLHQQALAIRRSTLGENHLDTAASLHNLALIAHDQGKFDDAASLYRQALAIRRQILGEEHPDTATTINNLAELSHDQGKFDDALALHQQALTIRRKILGNKHPDTIAVLNNLATVYRSQGKLDDALFWLQQALAIQRKTLGHEDLAVAATLSSLAAVYQSQGKLDDSAFWLQQALAIQRQVLGDEQPNLARTLETLAIAYEEQEQNEKAEALYQQALAIYCKTSGDNHPDTARCSYNLALLYQDQRCNAEARSLFVRALTIWQEQYGPNHPETKKAREKYEQLLQKQKEKQAKRQQGPQKVDEQSQDNSAGPKGIARVIGRIGRGKR